MINLVWVININFLISSYKPVEFRVRVMPLRVINIIVLWLREG